MDWLKKVSDDDLADKGLLGLAETWKELKAAKMAWVVGNNATTVRLQAAWVAMTDRRDNYNAILDELHSRGLK